MKTIFLLLLFFYNSLLAQNTPFNNTTDNQLEYFKTHTTNLYDENGYSIMNNLTGKDSIIMTGEALADFFGGSIATAGDVNGDGYDDVIVGAREYGSNNTGRVYIFYGGTTINNVADVTMTGVGSNNLFGFQVATAGDVNGDGYDDVIVGTISITKAYIFYGGNVMDNNADVVFTESNIWGFGYSVSTAGDVNGDGYSDVIVGSNEYGYALIYFGGSVMNNIADVILHTINGNITHFGWSVSSAGDVNGDGFSDVIVGAINNGGDIEDRAYIFYGGNSMDNSVDVTLYLTGWSVSSAGDVNGDGFSDVSTYSRNHSVVKIYFGGVSMNNVVDVVLTGDEFVSAGDVNQDGFSDALTRSLNSGSTFIYFGGLSMDSNADIVLNGQPNSGSTVANAGDVNGDGYCDIIIGNYKYENKGEAFLYYNIFQKPELITPIKNSINNPVTVNFSWKRIKTSMYYVLYVSKDSLFNNIVKNDTVYIDTIKTLNGFEKDTKYYWKIESRDSSGETDISYISNFTTVPPIQINIKLLFEGMYYSLFNLLGRKDSVIIYLHQSVPPYNRKDSAKSSIDSISFTGNFKFYNASAGNYYVTVKHLNSIETWSKSGGQNLLADGNINYYDFTTAISQAYGNNLKLKGSKYCIYGGNVNGDAIVDGGDLSEVDNDSFTGLTGRFLRSDVNGDNIVDAADVSLVDNNSYNSVVRMRP